MRIGSILVSLILLSSLAHAAPPGDAVETAEARSQQQLEASLAELAALRERIAAEKLPLVERLSALEERLVALRRQNDRTLRDVDVGGLDSSRLEAELKLRQDESAYIANLLDEYVRNFEAKLGVGEAERYAPLVEAAKAAAADANLPGDQRIEQQLLAVKASVARLDDVVGGTRFAGAAVDPQGLLAAGTFALVGPVALFAAADGSAAGVAVAQAGSAKPAVRPVNDGVSAAVTEIVRDGSGAMPLDASRGGALQELIQRTSIVHIFKKGGPIMWPLLFVSVLATATVMERLVFLARERSRSDPTAMSSFMAAVDRGRFDEAIGISEKTKDCLVRALGYALAHREKSLPSALLYASSREIKRFTRGLPILDTSITIAPLLGLLGTVTGMMGSFSLLGGELSAPAAITGGIAEALIATAFGLGIAIVALVPYNYLNNQTEEVRHDLGAASAQLELLARPWLDAPGPARQPAASTGMTGAATATATAVSAA
jgi:biopolymer transport protein ExbB